MSTDARRVRERLTALAAWSLLLGPSVPAAGAAEQEVARLDALRQAPVVLRGSARPASVDLRFDLPPGARQGPDRWYLVRLRYRLRLARDSGRGFVWVTSDTNGRTGAQVEYTTSRRRGRLAVRRTTVDLVHGQRERRGRFSTDRLTFANHLPYAGVQPGANTWTIRLEQAGRARVERLELLGDTAIVATDRTPFPLTITPVLRGELPQAGERFELEAVLETRPGEAVRDVVVRAQPEPGGSVALAGPGTRRVGELGRRRRTVSFRLVAREPGAATVTVAAESDRNDPNASVRVEVLPATRAAGAPVAVWALAALPALGMAGWLLASRRRRAG